VYETGDAGAVYVGRDWTAQGTVIRGNLFRDIRGSDARFQNAVYLDDMSSGITVEDNLFVRCNWGVLVGGGRDNTLRGNTFVDCGKAVSWDARGVGWMARELEDPSTSTLLRTYAAMPVASEAWKARYPNLGDYLAFDFGRPVRGVLEGSRLVGTPLGRIDDRARVVESGTVTADSVDLAESARAAIAAWRVRWRSMR
jgi:parallel beta-helix repeat protein